MRIADIRQIRDVAFPNNGQASEGMGGRAPEDVILVAQSVHDAVVGKSCEVLLGMFLSGMIICAEELGITKLQLADDPSRAVGHNGEPSMKVTVKISRDEYGIIKAHVIQDGQKGANLLPGHCMCLVINARLKAQAKLRGCEISWTGLTPDSDNKSIDSKRFWNPRDSYGWRSL